MTTAEMERSLRRARAERKRRRLEREAYSSVYRRIAALVPVVLPLAGETHTFPIVGESSGVVEALAPSCVFGFETALEIRTGRRLLNVRDVHAYVDAEPFSRDADGHACAETDWLLRTGLEGEVAPPRLVPALPRRPYLFLVVRRALPPSLSVDGSRVVTGEWMLREYLGALGHRFDLLAVVLHAIHDEVQA